MTDVLAWLNPYRWLLAAGLIAAVVLGVPIIVHRYDEARRDEGRAEARAQDKAAADAQATSNRELGRLAELHLHALAAPQTQFLARVSKEIHDAAAPLAACPVPESVRLRVNAAIDCAVSDSAAACSPPAEVPGTRQAPRPGDRQ